MTHRYMMYQRVYALRKFYRDNPVLDKKDALQVSHELYWLNWNIYNMNQYRGRRKNAKTKKAVTA